MIQTIDDQTLRAVCGVLGDTSTGLKGGEIGRLLADCGIADPIGPSGTKAYRLFEALSARQKRDGCGNHVLSFVVQAMRPVGYLDRKDVFEDRRARLNEVLAFVGIAMGCDGQVERTSTASTISEAQKRAGRLTNQLRERGVHHEVLRFCKAELLQDNYFHAVFEATKSVAERIRNLSGLTTDGAELVDQALAIPKGRFPRIAFNSLRTETECGEHRGFMNLIKGLFGAFRNVTAHTPKILWPINEQDALDILTLASLLHRRLDSAVRVP